MGAGMGGGKPGSPEGHPERGPTQKDRERSWRWGDREEDARWQVSEAAAGRRGFGPCRCSPRSRCRRDSPRGRQGTGLLVLYPPWRGAWLSDGQTDGRRRREPAGLGEALGKCLEVRSATEARRAEWGGGGPWEASREHPRPGPGSAEGSQDSRHRLWKPGRPLLLWSRHRAQLGLFPPWGVPKPLRDLASSSGKWGL